jgi:hypothetical protein
MRELEGRKLHSRIRGRAALERRMRALLIAVHRFARGRATAPAELRWCARVIDSLSAVLALEHSGEGRRDD